MLRSRSEAAETAAWASATWDWAWATSFLEKRSWSFLLQHMDVGVSDLRLGLGGFELGLGSGAGLQEALHGLQVSLGGITVGAGLDQSILAGEDLFLSSAAGDGL